MNLVFCLINPHNTLVICPFNSSLNLSYCLTFTIFILSLYQNEIIRKYYILGGMPGVVYEYITSRDIIKCQRIQRSIIDTYIDDFAKYSKVSSHSLLKKVFFSIPGMTGQQFVYAYVDRGVKSEKIKEALELLETAGISTRIRQTSGSGLPLSTGVHD